MKIVPFVLFVIVSCSFSQWSSDPGTNLMISTAEDEVLAPRIALGASGDSYVSWAVESAEGLDMRLQRLDLSGNAMWGQNGILVREGFSGGMVLQYDLATDLSGAAILAFSVWTGSGFVVYAYRISPDGDMQWGENGILLSDTSSASSIATFAKAAPVSSGDVVVSWSLISEPDSACTVLQRITPGGTVLWEDGIAVEPDSPSIYCWEATLCPTETDDIILVYTLSDAQGWNKRLYAMRYDPSGNPVWSDPAAISNSQVVVQQCIQPPPHPDGNGGFYITWEETLASGFLTTLVQHVSHDGVNIFSDGGVPASTLVQMNHATPFLSVAAEGEEVFIFWLEMNELQSQYGLYGQRMDFSGNRLWTNSGKAFIELQDQGIYQISTRGNTVDAAVFYTLGTTAGNDIAKCMLVDSTGGYVWSSESIILSNATCSREHFATTPLCWDQQWLVVWDDNRGTCQSVFAQNIQMDGTLGTAGLGIEEQSTAGRNIHFAGIIPNPITSEAILTAAFTLITPQTVTMELYDTSGRLVSRRISDFYSAGSHTADIQTENLPSGVYILQLTADGKTSCRACVLLR